jgi:hypothetical protein
LDFGHFDSDNWFSDKVMEDLDDWSSH